MPRQMKDSGIEWICEFPKQWSCNKVFRVFSLIGSGTTPKSNDDENFGGNIYWIQSGDINGGVLSATKNTVTENVVAKYSALKIYEKPFIVIAMYGASIGNISVSIIDGCVNQACCVLSGGDINADYAFYALKSAKDYLIYKAVGGGQPNISQDTVKQLWLPIPSSAEQQRIANFLDRKCAEIDVVIEKTKATIEEYKKLKQSVITEAVTKGIRGDRPMKDSGIEWVGEIPEEWNVSRIKYISDFEPSTDRSKLKDDSIITYTPMDCIKNGWFVNNTATLGNVSSSLTAYQEGDIVIAKVTPCFENGNIAIMKNLMSGFGLGSSELFVLRAKFIETEYLFYWLRNDDFMQAACSTMTGTGGLKRVSPDFVKNCYIHIPPAVEQQEIADYLDRKCAEFDKLIADKTHLLEELDNYKKSTIYEYVTGKKEVISI